MRISLTTPEQGPGEAHGADVATFSLPEPPTDWPESAEGAPTGCRHPARGLILDGSAIQDRIKAPEVRVNPGGDAGWDGTPLDVHIPDDARELERDVIAYHREQRALRRRRLLRRVMPAQAGIMPLLASILAVCLVAGMMLSVFTISPVDGPVNKTHDAKPRASASQSAQPSQSAGQSPSARPSAHAAGSAGAASTPAAGR
jgi:hypothetical protein